MSGSGPRLAPLPPGHSPELADQFASFLKTLGFVPNSVLTMQRKPALVRAFVAMQAAIWSPDSKVDRGLKRLIAFVASRAAQDAYSPHTASGALHFGIDPTKLAAAADFHESPRFTEAENSRARARRRRERGAEPRDRRHVRRPARTLERGADRRNCRDRRHGRVFVALE